MQIVCFKNYEQLSGYAADFIAHSIKNKPNLVLCMASGSTPALTCDLLVQKLKEEQKRADTLQHQIDAIKSMEKNLILIEP